VEFVVDKVALEQVLLPVLQFSAVIFIPKRVLVSAERLTTEAWETFRHSHAVADIGEALDSNALFLLEE
jgi:hypothetical protein